MLKTVEGIYREGHVELSERPEGIEEAKVLVTFLPQSQAASDRQALRERAFARMRQGLPLGGSPYPKREDLYDRHLRNS
ncbi:MAG: hypothetical protein ACJ75H_20270 [Thermoanaerobaculia bacterium]